MQCANKMGGRDIEQFIGTDKKIMIRKYKVED